MSNTTESDLPVASIEANREMLERLADSNLPISEDAQRTLELIDNEGYEQ